MDHIDAIYQQGVFKPLEQVSLAENQQVQLHVVPAAKESPQDWLQRVRARQRQIAEREGVTFDSAIEIALDRTR